MTLLPQSYQAKCRKVTKRNAAKLPSETPQSYQANAAKIPNNLVVLRKSIIFACK